MDALLAYFHTVSSSESQDIVARIKDKAGLETVLENERLLRELVDGNGGFSGDTVEVRGRRGVTFDVEEPPAHRKEFFLEFVRDDVDSIVLERELDASLNDEKMLL